MEIHSSRNSLAHRRLVVQETTEMREGKRKSKTNSESPKEREVNS